MRMLSDAAMTGLQCWAREERRDELLFEDIGSDPEKWAWIVFQLRNAADLPKWFPKGKWATIQALETALGDEADAFIESGKAGSK